MLSPLLVPVRTIDDVIDVMQSIDQALPPQDGLKWFNLLYLRTTQAMLDDRPSWGDWASFERLDVVFADLYFEALRQFERRADAAPRCWRPVFEARRRPGLARLQFALAGMNAHINHDLPLALDRTVDRGAPFPTRDSVRCADYRRVNEVLARLETSMHETLATGLIADVDRAMGDTDSLLAMWNIRKAREAAWTNGEVLCALRVTPTLQRDFLARLDLMVGFAGRGLLQPRLDLPSLAR